MLLSELDQDERYALLGLLKLIVRADHQLSAGETDELRRLAAEMGEELFLETTRGAHERFKKKSDIKSFCASITRPGARALLYDHTQQAAAVGGIEPEEAAELAWLAELWGLGVDENYVRADG